MIKVILVTSIVLCVLISLSCSRAPKPIDYGNDGCHYCKMTIVDKIHGAELITDKGKVFKFDATECMLNYATEANAMETSSFLTNYYEAPTTLISTKKATFLISEKLPSPMGAYLTAFESAAIAEKIQTEKGGEIHTWETLKAHLQK